MTKGGPLLNCPNCGQLAHCLSVPLAKAEQEQARNLYFTAQQDVRWYRRARQCSSCSKVFLTAEIGEKFLDELVSLRKRLIKKRQAAVNSIKRTNPWIERPETIPEDIAEGFLRKSCWWLTHSSGSPVRAPGHADRLYRDDRHGWAVAFGANTFLVGKAIERSAKKLKEFLDAAATGGRPSTEELKRNLRSAIAGAVANFDGNEYAGYYPITGNELTFGAQAIDLNDAVSYLLTKVDVERLFQDSPL